MSRNIPTTSVDLLPVVNSPFESSLAQAITRLQRESLFRLKALEAAMTPARVHEARTAVRRLRALLRLADDEGLLPLSPVHAASLKQINHALGQVRDLDVARPLLEPLVKRAQHAKSLSRPSSAFALRRRKLATQTRASIAPHLRELGVTAGQGLHSLNREQIETASVRRLKRYRKDLRKYLLDTAFKPKRLHRIRRKARTLRYCLQELASSEARDPEVLILARIQDSLGELQDLQVLKHLMPTDIRDRAAYKALRMRSKLHGKRLLKQFKMQRHLLLRLWKKRIGD